MPTPLDDLLEAVDRFYEAGLPNSPDENGMSARMLWGARLRIAADRLGAQRREESTRAQARANNGHSFICASHGTICRYCKEPKDSLPDMFGECPERDEVH